jgi:hypothetical protein
MNIDKKLNDMEPKDTPLLVLGYILLGMMLLLPATAEASDNVVYLNQTGDNLELNILQAGSDNSITNLYNTTSKATLSSTNAKYDFRQHGTGNNLHLYTSGSNTIQIVDTQGDSNTVSIDCHGTYCSAGVLQLGDFNVASIEFGNGGDHNQTATIWQSGDSNEAGIEANGDDNVFSFSQTGDYHDIVGITSAPVTGDDNVITIVQSGGTYQQFRGALTGNDNVLSLYQGGGGSTNFAQVSTTGNNNNGTVYQGKHSDGTIDVDEYGGHEAYWTISGDSNIIRSYQTDTNRTSTSGAPHHTANIITGDSNNVLLTQKGKKGHDGFIEITGDSNIVDLYQKGNGGVKWADIVLDGDGHSVDVNQRGGNNATATVDLTYGTGAYDFNLTQNVTSSAVTYSITGICQNVSGCSITVNQNN